MNGFSLNGEVGNHFLCSNNKNKLFFFKKYDIFVSFLQPFKVRNYRVYGFETQLSRVKLKKG